MLFPYVTCDPGGAFSTWVELSDEESACNSGDARDTGSIPELGRSPGEGNSNPLQYSCLENPMAGGTWQATYSPWGHKESDTTEQLHFLSFFPSHCLDIVTSLKRQKKD